MKLEGKNEMTPLQGIARLTALLFHHFAAEAEARLGKEEGRAMVARVISNMGEERGRAIRRSVDEAGEDPTLDNMYKYYDLPIGEGWEAKSEKHGDVQIETVTYCPFAETWMELGTEARDILYCDVDMAILRGYNPDIQIERAESLLQGDGRCVYEFRMNDKSGS